MSKIIRIDSGRHMDGEFWEVGQEIGWKSGKFITEIKDAGAEFETGMYERYDIYVNNKHYQSLVNMPVKITYELEETNNE